MPHQTIRQAVIHLLLLIMAMQPVLAFGQFKADPTEPSLKAHQVAMTDCCDNTGLDTTTAHLEQDMACGDMATADCALAANLGSCGGMLSVLVPEKADLPAQSSSGPAHHRPRGGYLSIILDTLTPPPNSSKA
ncbi:hypothetical protein [Marinobacter fonticola]|uniref:hypothetical protein n=1 Tax=Marinobacter fonticola TaxID=2603215 RepID=UPI0011E61CA0|nr:hypothetical protein [Marinobacter fonticola]